MSGATLVTFNRGVVSKDTLGRLDLDRTRMSASDQTNWMPRAMGGMSIRPGLGHIIGIPGDAKVEPIPFVFAGDDTAILLITASGLTINVDDVPISRALVATAISNGTFGSDLTGWTDADETAAASTWLTGGYMKLVGTRFKAAIRRQEVTVAGADLNTRHALRIVVERGPVILRVGSTAGDDDYITETTLGTGTHSLAFTPAGNFWVEFANRNQRSSLVDSVAVEGEGVMTLPVPYALADLPLLRWDQSNDVIFAACEGHQQRRIERRAVDSWSIILYEPVDGPFRLENAGAVQISSSALNGDVTLTASGPLFRSGHEGALFRIKSAGQRVELSANGENQFSNPIRVSGVADTRRYYWEITGTWTGTVTIQSSIAEPGSWTDDRQFNVNDSDSREDGLDNQIVYYRIGIKTGDYGSGTAVLVLRYSGGSIAGVVRINSVTSKTSAVAGVIEDLGNTSATQVWSEGAWSDYRGWPSAVAFYEGRLGWFGKSGVWQSVSDTVDSFDPTVVGDSGPISRALRYGSADAVCWAQAAQRLLVGTAGAELSIRSTSFDEPLTPTNFNVKPASTQGSRRNVAAVLIDGNVIFVQGSGTRVYELTLGNNGLDYTPIDLTALVPEIGEPEIVAMAVQRQPDTRIHCVRSDGKVAIAVIDKTEEVLAWVLFETDGFVEKVVRLPGDLEDQVYYVVKRTINGQTKRYLEKWAMQNECEGATLCKLLDSHKAFTGISSATLGGLSHLESKTVRCWADGIYQGEFTVTGGQIELPVVVSDAVVGLPYVAPFESVKLSIIFRDGSSSLGWPKNVKSLVVLARNLHNDGLKYGTEDVLYPLPKVDRSKLVPADTIWEAKEFDPLPVDGSWNSDSRILLTAYAPFPATILALAPTFEQNRRP